MSQRMEHIGSILPSGDDTGHVLALCQAENSCTWAMPCPSVEDANALLQEHARKAHPPIIPVYREGRDHRLTPTDPNGTP